MWVLAALTVGMGHRESPRVARSWIGRVLPLPILGALCLFYIASVWLPVTRSLSYQARLALLSAGWPTWEREWDKLINSDAEFDKRKAMTDRSELVHRALRFAQRAHDHDPMRIEPLIALATWSGERWKRAPDMKLRIAAAAYADVAAKLDPEGREPDLTAYRLNVLFARHSQSGTRELYTLAAEALARVARRDPTDALLRYQLAEAWLDAKRDSESRIQAQEARRLDALATEPSRRLTPKQRAQIDKWLSAP
jgi:hypothetical protein